MPRGTQLSRNLALDLCTLALLHFHFLLGLPFPYAASQAWGWLRWQWKVSSILCSYEKAKENSDGWDLGLHSNLKKYLANSKYQVFPWVRAIAFLSLPPQRAVPEYILRVFPGQSTTPPKSDLRPSLEGLRSHIPLWFSSGLRRGDGGGTRYILNDTLHTLGSCGWEQQGFFIFVENISEQCRLLFQRSSHQ